MQISFLQMFDFDIYWIIFFKISGDGKEQSDTPAAAEAEPPEG